MDSRRLRIAMVAPPWIEVPPRAYGGVEAAIGALVDALEAAGHTVELFTVETSTVRTSKRHHLYGGAQYTRIFSSLYDVAAVPVAHILFAREAIMRGDFDVVHDHNYLLGPALLAGAVRSTPVLHTLHGPFIHSDTPHGAAANVDAYERLGRLPSVYFVGISAAQVLAAPTSLRERILGVAHNGLSLDQVAAGLSLDQVAVAERERHGFVTMARFSADKGHDVAARLCRQLGVPLRLAGGVGPLDTPEDVSAAAASPASPYQANPEMQHFIRDVHPHLVPGAVEYVGSVGGLEKSQLLDGAEALLMPVKWDEPFGVSAVEALAHGTPVIAFARGALPEIIEDGRTGFLAEDEAGFVAAMKRIDEIDREQCRKVAHERFSGSSMAQSYVRLYEEAIRRERKPVA